MSVYLLPASQLAPKWFSFTFYLSILYLLEYFVFKVDLSFYFHVSYRNYMYTDVFLHIFKDGLRMSVDAKFNKYILHVHYINTTYCII